MTDQITRWDPSLLRKFSSTGHFRLLNQLKGDLRKKPLDRDQRTGQLRSLGGNRGSTRRTLPPKVSPPVTLIEDVEPVAKDDQPKSFRERLNAIDMR